MSIQTLILDLIISNFPKNPLLKVILIVENLTTLIIYVIFLNNIVDDSENERGMHKRKNSNFLYFNTGRG